MTQPTYTFTDESGCCGCLVVLVILPCLAALCAVAWKVVRWGLA